MNKIMETKKRKYVKPKLTVAEWDFNEAICEQQVTIYSNCLNVHIPENGGIDAIDNRGEYVAGDENSWNKWPNN